MLQNISYPSFDPSAYGAPQKALQATSSHAFSEIGRGSYGVVFEKRGTLDVVKRPINQPGSEDDNSFNLWNDFKMHTRIYQSFQAGSYYKVHVPRPLEYVSAKDNGWWSAWTSSFEDEYEGASNMLFSERVLPVPQPVRDVLADCFCPEAYREATKASAKNENCLMLPLLGRRKGDYTLRGMMNLRNFEFCVDQMEKLDFNINRLIDTMAESLAMLHFQAHVDAHDIEFVFGAAPTAMHNDVPPFEKLNKMASNSSVRSHEKGFNLRGSEVHLWIIDFNRVSRISGPDKFVAMALKGFIDQSKAYYPRPRFPLDNSNDNKNWNRFKAAYTRFSRLVRKDMNIDLQEQFLNAVENHYKVVQLRQGTNDL